MSTTTPPEGAEQAFYESQRLPSKKRGMTFEALFYRQLHQVTARIHDTENIEQIMLETSQEICKLLNADRLTLYAMGDDKVQNQNGLEQQSGFALAYFPAELGWLRGL